jgi:hypothetical protein
MEKHKWMRLKAWHEKKNENMPLVVLMWMFFYYL